jgi:putative membrane protein
VKQQHNKVDIIVDAHDGLAAERTDLAIERTVMAANRTLMAWIRTALATISFGFTLYKILLSARAEKLSMGARMSENSPKRIGLFLICLGTIAVILGTIEYYNTMRHLDSMTTRTYKPWNFSTVVGVLVGLLGLFLVVTILFNMEVL